MADIPYPLVNGNRYEFASIEIKIRGKRYLGFKSVNYSQEVDKQEVRGTHRQKLGRTAGEVKPEASLEMYEDEFNALVADLGDGFYDVPFDIPVSYAEGAKITTDVIHGAEIKKVEKGHSQGSEALTVKLDLDVMWIEYAGKKPLKRMLGGAL